jgi:hypothetical protein
MAAHKIERVDLFPNTTVVKAYARSALHIGQVGAPSGAVEAEATMTSGVAEVTGLVAGSEYVAYASVSGKDVYLEFQVEATPAGTVAAASAPYPGEHKLLGFSFDPVMASGTKILETAGTLHVAKVLVPEACKISNIHMWMTTAGGTLTALENGLGLFAEGTRKLLSKAAIAGLITQWEGATGEVKTALEEPQNVPAGYVLVGAYFKGTTAPTFATGPSTIGAVNLGVKETGSRFATGDTGLTTALPNPITASMVASSQPFLVGVS